MRHLRGWFLLVLASALAAAPPATAPAQEPVGGFWVRDNPLPTLHETKDETAGARELEACVHSVSLSMTHGDGQTAAKRREPCSGAGTAFTGPITHFRTEAWSSTHSWTPLPERARAGDAFDLAVHVVLNGEMSDPSGRPMLGGAGTALVERASGRTLAAAGAEGRQGGEDSKPLRFTFPPPDPRGDGVLGLLVRIWGPGGVAEISYRYHFVTSAQVERTLKVEAFDGQNDPTREHLPLSLWVTVTEKGKPLAGAPVWLGLSGDLQCLADAYDVWDEGGRDWREATHNFLRGPVDPAEAPRTGRDGTLVFRLRMDFTRRRAVQADRPCPLPFSVVATVSTPSDAAGRLPPLTQRAPFSVASVVYLFSVHYHEVGPASTGPWRPLSELASWSPPIVGKPSRWQAGDDRPRIETPTQARVRSRILLGDQPFPYVGDRPFFLPVAPGTLFRIDATGAPMQVEGEDTGAAWAVPQGHGIAVAALWLDGAVGVFQVHNRSGERNSVLWLRFTDGSERSTSGLTPGEKAADFGVRLVVGQAGDFLVRTAVVGAAAMAGGPAAAEFAAVVVGLLQKGADIRSANETIEAIDTANAQLVFIRSTVAVVSGPRGLTLYNFEGSPGVVAPDGTEVRAAAGQAIDFAPGGEVGAPETREAPPAALGLLELSRRAVPGPGGTGPSTASLTAGSASGVGTGTASGPGRAGSPAILALFVLAVGGAAIGLVALGLAVRRRRRRSVPAAAAAAAPPVAPSLALVALDGPAAGRAWPLGEALRIGREQDNDVALDDVEASRHHAHVQRFAEGWSVTDLGSANGTLLDGAPVTSAWLAEGQVLTVGTTRFRVVAARGDRS